MTTVTVENPDSVTVKKVDDRGRVYVGRDHRNKHVRVVLEAIDSEEREREHHSEDDDE